MTNDVSQVIKSLVQQCNIKALQSKDLVRELTTLYQSVENLERDLQLAEDRKKNLTEKLVSVEDELRRYKETYVTPVEQLKTDRANFDKEKFKFDVEREYAKREIVIYTELVKNLTSVRSTSESYYGGNNGTSWNHNQVLDKPCLPPSQANMKMRGET